MKWQALLVLVAGLCVLGETAGQDAGKKDLAKLEGTWIVTLYETNGVKADLDKMPFGKITIKGGKYTWSGGSWGTVVIDPTKKPKQVDYSILDAEGIVHTYQGIYEIEGDTFKDCMAPPGMDRPTEFKTTPDSGHIMMVFKRDKGDKGQ